MAEITRKRTGELLRALFELLMPQADGMPAGEALRALEKKAPPTPFEQSSTESGARRYEKIVRFATVDCVKAQWMIKAHGRWTITDEGRKAYAAYPDPEAFYKRAVYLYHEWRKSTPKATGGEEPVDGADPGTGKAARITFEQAEEQAWSEIEKYLASMQPYEFQELVAALLRGMGYHVGWVAPPGKDGGVDIVAYNDPLGTRPPRIKVQVKRQQQKVAVDGLRSFMAVVGVDEVGIFVNAGGFTRDAEDEARSQHARRVTLVDLERLVDLWVEHYARLDEAARRRLPLQPIYFLAPES
ncbi:restriction endonuclease [Gemmatirosa kalamazoonensis]|uniref:Restriction endonuclease n=1 Tax=Gemmatirosa kalamazoonensis TaxID=861299 RepID=W0RGD3_9BACT|nr:restriction endonuclease [Gemmatirosa kalamazoonensis]AHG89836.1 restriction endonuclease [Gemmatirosa kalamazoonensis]